MTDTQALVLLILWLAAVVTLAIGSALLIISCVIVERPAGQLGIREVLVPLWCLLAGREQRERLQEILRARETVSQAGTITIRDVARHRAEKQLYEPRHERPKRAWLDELDDGTLLDRDGLQSWMLLCRRWPPYP